MKRNPSPARCRNHAAMEPQPVCRKCRLVQRRGLHLGRVTRSAPTNQAQPALKVSDAVQAALADSWKGLSERSKRALNTNAAGKQGEEAALTELARLLLDCAGVLFKRALTARHNRPGE